MYCQIKNTSLFFIVILFAVSDVNGSDYTRLINPPLTITINGESQQLTGGLNRPEPQFIDWNNDGILDCFINDRDGRLQFWEGLEDWQFGDRPIFAMQTKFFQYLEIGNWFNFNDFDGDGDFDLLCNTSGT
ncbi:MAG: FG-GAP-like repeat-containing protein, partial [Candidatus Neomarinimicrobiota bacterium]|nr:FG-GAP-like repeat-containing protein [Candidatus Neomarinimicrobiota bacterium]